MADGVPLRPLRYGEAHRRDTLGIPFYADAVQCINRNRLELDFHLLRPIAERR